MRIAVAGGTGVVGIQVVAALVAAGHDPVVLARSTGVDVVSGSGLAAAIDGADAIIDVSGVTTSRGNTATAFFSAAAATLVATRLPLLVLSIVGVDRTPLGYYRAKLAQEQIVLRSDATTVLRTTQFYEFATQTVARGFGPVVPVPRMRVQPIAAREVAEHLVSLAADLPGGRAPELAGPRVEDMVALVRRVAGPKWVLPVRIPGPAGRAMNGGGLLPLGQGPRGVMTFNDWIAARH